MTSPNRAKTVRREVYVRPGLRTSAEVYRELGTPTLRGQLVARKRRAFAVRPDSGTMEEIDPQRFCAESATEVLECGFYFEYGGRWEYNSDDERVRAEDYHPVFVVVTDQPSAPAGTDRPSASVVAMPEHISPFLELMIEAGKEFKITADTAPVKKVLTEYFESKTVAGRPVSKHQAASMATLVRWPEAMKGGNPKG